MTLKGTCGSGVVRMGESGRERERHGSEQRKVWLPSGCVALLYISHYTLPIRMPLSLYFLSQNKRLSLPERYFNVTVVGTSKI